jgi:hypothetical protein
MTQSDRDAARALFIAAMNAFGVKFEAADMERLAAEFADHVRDGKILVDAMAVDSEPLASVRTGW